LTNFIARDAQRLVRAADFCQDGEIDKMKKGNKREQGRPSHAPTSPPLNPKMNAALRPAAVFCTSNLISVAVLLFTDKSSMGASKLATICITAAWTNRWRAQTQGRVQELKQEKKGAISQYGLLLYFSTRMISTYLIDAETFAIGFGLKEVVLFVDGAGDDNLLNGSED
jgi:hypothetical protein